MRRSLLSEKQIVIPELGDIVAGQRGFNVIATANTRDRGVNEMGAALKRRFNFVIVPVVEDLDQEIRIVTQREEELRSDYEVGAPRPAELSRMLVTMFQELRAGVTKDGRPRSGRRRRSSRPPTRSSVLFQAGILARSFGDGTPGPRELARSLVGAIAKEAPEDKKALREYCETVAKARPGAWKDLHAAAKTELR